MTLTLKGIERLSEKFFAREFSSDWLPDFILGRFNSVA